MPSQVNLQGGFIENVFHGQMRVQPQAKVLAGDVTLTKDSPTLQFLDANGAARNVDLPAFADSRGLMFIIHNTAAGIFSLTVRAPGPATVVVVAQDKGALVYSDGVSWQGILSA